MNFEQQEKPISPEDAKFESMLRGIRENSPYIRREERGGDCILEYKGEKFKLERIKSSEQPEVEDIKKIMEDTFNKEEIEPIEVIRAGIDGKTIGGEKASVDYKIYIVKDEKEKMLAFLAGGISDLKDKNGRDTNELAVLGAYIVTKEPSQRHGLGRELYASAFIDAYQKAKETNKRLLGGAGEANDEVEPFFNAVGFTKRAYSKIDEKK